MAIKIIFLMTELGQYKAWKEEDTDSPCVVSIGCMKNEGSKLKHGFTITLNCTLQNQDYGLGKQQQGEFLS